MGEITQQTQNNVLQSSSIYTPTDAINNVQERAPGAYCIEGPGISSTSTPPSQPVNIRCLEPTTVAQVVEPIIDGVLVPQSKNRCKWIRLQTIALYLFIMFVALIAIYLITEKRDLHYQIKQYLIPISGENALDDKTSVQHYCWMTLVRRISVMDNLQEIRKDSYEVIQRYLSVLIPLSTMMIIDWNPQGPVQPVCDVYMCNDEEEISVMVLRNNVRTIYGGGTIAREVGELKGLTHLIMSRDGLKGTIPTEIGKLKNLRVLDLHGNMLTGTVPSEIGQLRKLEWIFLDGNTLEGTLPTEIGSLQHLYFGNFSHNSFTGSIPLEMSEMVNLNGLALNGNQITGSINFMCRKYFRNESFSLAMNLRSFVVQHRYNYTGSLGLTVNCSNGESSPACECCVCG